MQFLDLILIIFSKIVIVRVVKKQSKKLCLDLKRIILGFILNQLKYN